MPAAAPATILISILAILALRERFRRGESALLSSYTLYRAPPNIAIKSGTYQRGKTLIQKFSLYRIRSSLDLISAEISPVSDAHDSDLISNAAVERVPQG